MLSWIGLLRDVWEAESTGYVGRVCLRLVVLTPRLQGAMVPFGTDCVRQQFARAFRANLRRHTWAPHSYSSNTLIQQFDEMLIQ